MANGHGGGRQGAGRKPKSRVLRSFDGGAAKRGRSATAAPTVPAPVDEFDAPDCLTTEQRLVWLELAPYAFAARTLTKGTMAAFIMLCRNVVTERGLAASALAGTPDHRGMIQRVDAELGAFSLRPCGKAIYEAEDEQRQAPTNPLDRFTSRRA